MAGTTEDDLAFVLTGGCAPLDLVATLGRRRSTAPVERLTDGAALARWLVESGHAHDDGVATDGDLALAVRLREAIYSLLRRRIGAAAPSADEERRAIGTVNDVAARPAPGRSLAATATGLVVVPTAGPAGDALAGIAREAVELLGGPAITRVKECEHPDCTLVFLDQTQAGRRRWCSMTRCGNVVKVARYRARQR